MTDCLARDKILLENTEQLKYKDSKNESFHGNRTQPWPGWFSIRLERERQTDHPQTHSMIPQTFKWDSWQTEWINKTQESCLRNKGTKKCFAAWMSISSFSFPLLYSLNYLCICSTLLTTSQSFMPFFKAMFMFNNVKVQSIKHLLRRSNR